MIRTAATSDRVAFVSRGSVQVVLWNSPEEYCLFRQDRPDFVEAARLG
jgi:hypothetical protein